MSFFCPTIQSILHLVSLVICNGPPSFFPHAIHVWISCLGQLAHRMPCIWTLPSASFWHLTCPCLLYLLKIMVTRRGLIKLRLHFFLKREKFLVDGAWYFLLLSHYMAHNVWRSHFQWVLEDLFIFIFFKKDFIYLNERGRERERGSISRGRGSGRGRSRFLG